MCEHSQTVALELQAMQFNFVALSNEGAWQLWNKLGFDTVGRLPTRSLTPNSGTSARLSYKWLAPAVE